MFLRAEKMPAYGQRVDTGSLLSITYIIAYVM
jgi:hypothetical protein